MKKILISLILLLLISSSGFACEGKNPSAGSIMIADTPLNIDDVEFLRKRELASRPLAVTGGIIGATTGAALGEFQNSFQILGPPPERNNGRTIGYAMIGGVVGGLVGAGVGSVISWWNLSYEKDSMFTSLNATSSQEHLYYAIGDDEKAGLLFKYSGETN